jgi:hypothetical protein
MRRTDLSLDEEIAEVEGRLSQRRMALRALSDDARSRVNAKSMAPIALIAALAVGFAASRFLRRPPPSRLMAGRRPSTASRVAQVAGAVASILLPRLIGPLQGVVAQWLQQRMRRPSV